ncbi:MAG TPA: UDP-N-acetylmuramoyl-tripeptide--D-alanyl-D-alanine ligase, partial [Clostridiaceae bacterium]|nr:UDP-N-acetylmuramoyl-tripeptide--D-alanyl-D-alanine ligase [Clostridiaceae bacterium]
MKTYPLASLVDVLDAKVFVHGDEICVADLPAIYFNKVSTDSRQLEDGTIFVPLIGARFDGHRYLGEAVRKGAVAVLTQSLETALEQQVNVPILLVSDTLAALRQLAAWYRSQLQGRVI